MSSSLEMGFELDRQWHWLRGEMDQSKKPALLALARVLSEAAMPYAIIGGLAMQVHQAEPRTTLDIDVAVTDLAKLPRTALVAAGFTETGTHAHSNNWTGPGGTPVQFTDDPLLGPGVLRADDLTLDRVTLKILRAEDMLHAKLRAAGDPARRRSKRLQDLSDAQALLETQPALSGSLSDEERALLASAPS